jgi:1-pyrroline-5-carboxylate dehydrogenase
MFANYKIPVPQNEQIKSYSPGSPERESLKKKLEQMYYDSVEIPLIIDGKEVRTGDKNKIICPHDHEHKLGEFHKADKDSVEKAIISAKKAKPLWSSMPFKERASIFLKGAELLSGTYRDLINATTMLGQSKSCYQAEIDAACEMIDFLRFNVYFAESIYNEQPFSSPGIWNYMEYRPLEGFVYAVTPFNFTSIGGNLPTAPAIMGNTVIWKPASTAVYSNYYLMKILMKAGLPDGVINFIPGHPGLISDIIFNDPLLNGIHFTGSTEVFNNFCRTMMKNMRKYKNYPVIVGETGGKDFIFAHKSCDPGALIASVIRGSFEYQGQKCSASSRAYIPKTMWKAMEGILLSEISTIKMGDVRDFSNFMNGVIDKRAFDNIMSYIDYAKKSEEAQILIGGNGDEKTGYFIEPTVILTENPHFKTMEEEIFGPVLTIYPYDDNKYEETLEVCDKTSLYALTGSIFATDRSAIELAHKKLIYSAGNFYINDKPSGAVVGQQPFGGSRASGTNDKAGSAMNLRRWVNPRTVKENFMPTYDYRYSFSNEA